MFLFRMRGAALRCSVRLDKFAYIVYNIRKFTPTEDIRMDKSVIFKACNIIAIVLGGLLCLISLIAVIMVAIATSGDDVLQGGATLFTTLALIFPIATGVMSILAGKAGLQSDPYLCKKMSLYVLILMAVSALSALRAGTFNFLTVLELAFYAVYCYLAHTEAY